MKIRDCVLAASLALAMAPPAAAALKTITFDVSGQWTIIEGVMPFGLSSSPLLHGTFTYDDSTSEPYFYNSTAFRDFVAVDFTAGTQTFQVISPNSLFRTPTDLDPNEAWYVWLDDIFSPNSSHTNLISSNQAFLWDGENSAGCFENCVTYSVTDGAPGGGPVPEPATWAMLILGFGLIGAAFRRDRARPA
jgi:hypothetical protein